MMSTCSWGVSIECGDAAYWLACWCCSWYCCMLASGRTCSTTRKHANECITLLHEFCTLKSMMMQCFWHQGCSLTCLTWFCRFRWSFSFCCTWRTFAGHASFWTYMAKRHYLDTWNQVRLRLNACICCRGQTRSDLQTVSKGSAWSKITRKTKAYWEFTS